jgi:carboxymethylenebutenolidase
MKIWLPATDGLGCSAYRADPEGAPRGGLVLVQEIFGVNRHIREVADYWASRGFLVVAPAIYDRIQPDVELGYTPEDIAKGRALRTELGTERPMLDLAAAVREASAGGKVAMVGFCWGALLTWLAAEQLEGLSGAVCFYGVGIVDRADQKLLVPAQLHFGEKDASIPLDKVHALADKRPELEIYTYPDAGHGFSCDHRADYHAPSAELGRERMEEFLVDQLGQIEVS